MSRCNLRKSLSFASFLLKRNRKLSVLFFSLMMLAGPLRFIFSRTLVQAITPPSSISYEMTISLELTLLVALIFAVILAFDQFSYLNKRQELDFIDNLPMSRSHYFLTVALTSLVNLIFVCFTTYFVLSLVYLGYSSQLLLIPGLITILCSSFVFVLCIFVFVNATNVFDAIVQLVLLSLLPFFFYLAWSSLTANNIVGAANNAAFHLTYFSPMFYVLNSFQSVGIFFTAIPYDTILPLIDFSFYLYYFLATIGLLLVSCFIVRKRSLETIRDMSNRPLSSLLVTAFTIVLQLILIVLICPFIIIRLDIILLLLAITGIAVILYILIHSLFDKSFKNTFKHGRNYLIIGLLTTLTVLTIVKNQGFMLLSDLPEVNEVTSVDLYYKDQYVERLPFHTNIFSENPDYIYPQEASITLYEPQDIQRIIDISSQFTAWYREYYNSPRYLDLSAEKSALNTYSNYDFNLETATVDITYHLNNGQKKERSYRVPINWTRHLVDLMLQPNHIVNKLDLLPFKNDTEADIVITDTYGMDTVQEVFTDKQLKALLQALKNDFKAIDLKSSDYQLVHTLRINKDYEFLITDHMVETLKLFNDLDIKLPSRSPSAEEVFVLIPEPNIPLFYYGSKENYHQFYYPFSFENQLQYYKLSRDEFKTISHYFVPEAENTTASPIVFIKLKNIFMIANEQHIEEIIDYLKDKPSGSTSFADFIDMANGVDKD